MSSFVQIDKFNNFVWKTFRNIPVLGPEARVLIVWNFLFQIQLTIQLFYIPYYFVLWQIKYRRTLTDLIINQSIPIIFYVIDIIFTLNTSIQRQGRVYSNRIYILQEYMKEKFLLDVIIMTFQMMTIFTNLGTDIILILKVIRFYEVIRKIEIRLSLKERFRQFTVVKLVINLLLLIHYCACAFLIIGVYEYQAGENSWIDYYKLNLNHIGSLYIHAFYWSAITLLTVGYGDVTPQTPAEKIFCIFIAMVTIGVVGYVINSIGQALKEMNDREEIKNEKMSQIDFYMRKNNIPLTLRLRVKDYYEYYYSSEYQQVQQDNEATENLDPELKRELTYYIYKPLLKKSKYLKKFITKKCLKELCQVVKQEVLPPGKIICERNKQASSLLFLKSGSISISNLIQNQSEPFTQILNQQGQAINEVEFLLQQDRPYDAIAETRCQIIQLNYDDFIQTLQKFPKDYEQYNRVKQLDKNSLEARKFGSCEFCQHQNQFKPHFTSECFLHTLKLNKVKILQNLNNIETNDRQVFQRKMKRSKESGFQLIQIQNDALKLIFSENNECDDYLFQPNYLSQLGFTDLSLDPTTANQIQPENINILLEESKQLESTLQPTQMFRKLREATKLIVHGKITELQKKANRPELIDAPPELISIQQDDVGKIPTFPSLVDKKQNLNQKTSTHFETVLKSHNQELQQDQTIQQSYTLIQTDIRQFDQIQNMSFEQQLQNQSWETIPGFERMHTYSLFFPQFNLEVVLEEIPANKFLLTQQQTKRHVMTEISKRKQRSIQSKEVRNSQK